MPSSGDNFEEAKSRAWDILAVAMGGGAIGIPIAMGSERFIKRHKTDHGNIAEDRPLLTQTRYQLALVQPLTCTRRTNKETY